MYSFQRMKPGQIAIQASLCTQEEEEVFRQKLLGDKPEHRIGFAFISGTSDELRKQAAALRHRMCVEESDHH